MKKYSITAKEYHRMPNGDVYLRGCEVEHEGEVLKGFYIVLTPQKPEVKGHD